MKDKEIASPLSSLSGRELMADLLSRSPRQGTAESCWQNNAAGGQGEFEPDRSQKFEYCRPEIQLLANLHFQGKRRREILLPKQ